MSELDGPVLDEQADERADERADDPADDPADERADDPADDPAGGHASGTGHPQVDAVVASTEGLEDRPVAEHVEVFESAHERLRAALADAGDPPGGS